jgi:hypothetical protein
VKIAEVRTIVNGTAICQMSIECSGAVWHAGFRPVLPRQALAHSIPQVVF